ncbi:MAG: hypothetical protein E6713_06480 [Sporomusaceae bacterium]|nr:hypothetical protein [Sporomusaceae bacterium]
MPTTGNKATGLNLDCVLGNISVTVVTCCGYVFQGTIEDRDNTRAQYGYPVVFPTITMDYAQGKEDEECCDKKDEKKEHCHKPIEVDVNCENNTKFICLRLTCLPGNLCCEPTAGVVTNITPIVGTATGAPDLFLVDDTVLINIADIVAIGPSRTCLTPA